MHRFLDTIYSKIANRDHFFQAGWGDREGLNYILTNDPLEIHSRPVKDIKINWESGKSANGITIREGSFATPFEFEYRVKKKKIMIELPDEAKRAYVQLILPKKVEADTPLVLQFAATGDEGFTRRRISMAIPLAKIGIGSLILENPFYGRRRPNGQKGVVIRSFTEFLRMSRATADEGIALLKYFKNKGHRILGVTGISMGGYVAITTAARSNLELAVAACIPCHSGAPVYIEGALSRACDWKKLHSELNQNEDPKKFMKAILDRGDIRTFPKPKRMDAVVIVGARRDAYIPKYSTEIIKENWPDATLRWVSPGHVGSFLFCAKDFRKAVVDSFTFLKKIK